MITTGSNNGRLRFFLLWNYRVSTPPFLLQNIGHQLPVSDAAISSPF